MAEREWQGAEIHALARSQLAHLAPWMGARLELFGPELVLRPGAAQILGMAIHELGTNAMKYGAFSTDAGSVRLAWDTSGAGDAEPGRFRMRWEEHGGPPVAAVERRGFGRTVTVEMVTYELEGTAEWEPRPEGVVWRVTAPADRVLFKMRLAA